MADSSTRPTGLQVEDHVVGEEEREARVHLVVRFSRRIVLHVNVAGVDHRGGLELEEPCGSTPGGAGRESNVSCHSSCRRSVRVVPGDKLGVLRREGLGAVLSVVHVVVAPVSGSIPTPGLLRGRLFCDKCNVLRCTTSGGPSPWRMPGWCSASTSRKLNRAVGAVRSCETVFLGRCPKLQMRPRPSRRSSSSRPMSIIYWY